MIFYWDYLSVSSLNKKGISLPVLSCYPASCLSVQKGSVTIPQIQRRALWALLGRDRASAAVVVV